MVEWYDLDVYDKLLRIIDMGTHHIKFHDFQDKSRNQASLGK
jgi:hypothetical protein